MHIFNFFGIIIVSGGVTLTELRVPSSVMAGVKSGVVLDCLYTLRPNSVGLVVAWYFNNSARPVYQWIPGQKPLSIGVFRHRANLDYKVSDDNDTMHRYYLLKFKDIIIRIFRTQLIIFKVIV